jgi:hypothetical protein
VVRVFTGVTLLLAGCSLLTDLGALGDQPPDSSTSDADSSTSDVEAGPPVCVATPLVGTADLTGLTPDIVSAGSLAVFRFDASAGVARCAWIYVSSSGTSVSSVFLAAYDLDDAGEPSKLLATGTLSSVSVGWNSAPLDHALTFDAGAPLWIGALSPTGSLPILDTSYDGGCQPRTREDTPLAFPPPTFDVKSTFPPCNMGIYLGP